MKRQTLTFAILFFRRNNRSFLTACRPRAAVHLQRILANDPNGMVILKTVD